MNAEIYYRQSREDRYDTDMNERVAALLDSLGIPIVGTWGGTFLAVDGPLGSENAFVLATDEDTARRAARLVEDIVGQPVAVEMLEDD